MQFIVCFLFEYLGGEHWAQFSKPSTQLYLNHSPATETVSVGKLEERRAPSGQTVPLSIRAKHSSFTLDTLINYFTSPAEVRFKRTGWYFLISLFLYFLLILLQPVRLHCVSASICQLTGNH